MGSGVTVRSRESTWLWFAKMATGVLVLAVLLIHLVVNHLVAQGGLLSYDDVLHYYAHPIVPLMEGSFLILVVSHALLGLRGIALDFNPRRGVLRILDAGLLLFGMAAITYGLWLLTVLAMRAA